MDRQHSSGLYLPERTVNPVGTHLSVTKAVKTWIQGLPTADTGETARQLFKAVVEFNRQEVQDLKRIKIAELFRDPITYVSDNLRKTYLDAEFPLSAKTRKTAVLNRELQVELAISYKIFIDQTVSRKSSRHDRRLLIIAIHRAMQCLSKVQYHAAIIYDPCPENTWKEIYWLYSYAEQQRIQHVPIKDAGEDCKSNTIAQLFKQTLLFAINSPYCLRQSEIEQVYSNLPEWESRTSLQFPENRFNSDTLYVVRLTEDAPPAHISIQTMPVETVCRHLDIKEYLDYLRDEYNLIDTRSGIKPLTNNDRARGYLLDKLIQGLNQSPERRFVRIQLNFELRTAVGLATIHRLISTGTGGTRPASQHVEREPASTNSTKSPKNLPRSYQPRYTVTDSLDYGLIPMGQHVDESISVAGDMETMGQRPDYQPVWIRNVTDDLPTLFTCKTFNECAGGYCIQWSGPGIPGIKVGEILGIQSPSDTTRFCIGKCRWIKNNPGVDLQIGMQITSPTSEPVTIQRVEPTGSGVSVNKALLLSELDPGQGPTLLVPALSFWSGDHLWMHDVFGKKQIRLTRLLDSTGAFAQYSFVDMNSGVHNHHKDYQETDVSQGVKVHAL
ncbi:MAG: hypothetical protein GY703_07575 [Gammaproteobacteria bacterium]|nr:hypothetical protein [Gammaproteobacteria bacterium]